MLNFQIIVYDNHRSKICLLQNIDEKLETPCVSLGNCINEYYKNAIIREIKENYNLDVEIERPALIQFDTEKKEFFITFVVKETKHNSYYDWFSLNNLPKNIEEFTMRALRAEMQDITYEICEYTRSKKSKSINSETI